MKTFRFLALILGALALLPLDLKAVDSSYVATPGDSSGIALSERDGLWDIQINRAPLVQVLRELARLLDKGTHIDLYFLESFDLGVPVTAAWTGLSPQESLRRLLRNHNYLMVAVDEHPASFQLPRDDTPRIRLHTGGNVLEEFRAPGLYPSNQTNTQQLGASSNSITSSSKGVREVLLEVAKSDDPELRKRAAAKLAKLMEGSREDVAEQTLEILTQDPNPELRAHAFKLLEIHHRKQMAAIDFDSALNTALHDTDPGVREAALNSLASRIDETPEGTFPNVVPTLSSIAFVESELGLKETATDILLTLQENQGYYDPGFLASLEGAVSDPNSRVREIALSVLNDLDAGLLSPDVREGVAWSMSAMAVNDPDANLRGEALQNLWDLQEDTGLYAEALKGALNRGARDTDASVRELVLDTLTDMEDNPGFVIAMAREMAQTDPDLELRERAADLLDNRMQDPPDVRDENDSEDPPRGVVRVVFSE